MRKVIVTGASGFIGKALCKKLLDTGTVVYAVVRNAKKMKELLSNTNLKIVISNLDEYASLPDKIKEDVDVFYHLAWEGTFGESFKNYRLQMNNAVYAGDALLAAIKIGCKKFIFAGTIVELEVKRFVQMDECEPRISCIYGTAKMAGEMMCKTLAYNYGIDFNMAIIASVYGEGDYSEMIQNVLLKAFNNGTAPKLIEGNNLYDWIYIDDVVDALISIGEKGKKFKTYYVGHRELKTFKELVTAARDSVKPDIPLRFGELKESTPVDYSLVDLDALYNDTGFEAKADFKESIIRTSEWLKQQT